MMSDNSTILEGLPSALIVVLVCLVAAAGVWYLAIRFRQPRLKVTPRSQSGQNATGSVALHFIVRTPRVKSFSEKGSAPFQFKRNGCAAQHSLIEGF